MKSFQVDSPAVEVNGETVLAILAVDPDESKPTRRQRAESCTFTVQW